MTKRASKRKAQDDSFFIADIDFKKVQQRFLALNKLRLKKTQDSLRHRQQDFLELLPLLFHVNHPMLPGYVSLQTPVGIPNYNPSNNALRAARKLSRSFEHKRRAYREFQIDALFLMGSTGTVAYSDRSDYDIWVCHKESLDAEQLSELKLKTERIQAWAATLDMEVNFFLINPARFRSGEIEELSSESSGSTQHHLLLEEFYRTSMLVAGRYPIWWIVPPQFEEQYTEYVEDIKRKRLLHAKDFIDFGEVANVPADEFFGATLWHIYKGIDSPYKAILKLLLMESYAQEYPDIELLCNRFKKAIYSDEELNSDKLDPYLMMMEKVTEHLQKQDSTSRLRLARQCLYFKVGQRLSEDDNPKMPEWRRALMRQKIKSWGWSKADLIMLDARQDWKIDQVISERKNIVDAFTKSYRSLSEFFRKQGQKSRISRHDMTILGRKLYASFERKAGKIDLLNNAHDYELLEQQVSIHWVRAKNGDSAWLLYLGRVAPGDLAISKPIKRAAHLLELLAWCYFNGLVNSRTLISLHGNTKHLSNREVKQLLEALERLYPGADVGKASIEELGAPAKMLSSGVFVNVGIDPFARKYDKGTYIASKQTDSLRYGGLYENLAISIDVVMLSSWREVHCYHYSGATGLLDCLCLYLRWYSESAFSQVIGPSLVASYSSNRSVAIANRIEELINDVINTFAQTAVEENPRYLLAIGHRYYLIWIDDNGPQHMTLDDRQALEHELASPLPRYSSLMMDKYSCSDATLPKIFSENQPDRVQLFYSSNNSLSEIYVLDERGTLFQQQLPVEPNAAQVNHYVLFLDSVINRLTFNEGEGDFAFPELELNVYRIKRRAQKVTLEEQLPSLYSLSSNIFTVQVLVDITTEGHRRYAIFCDNVEFTSLEYGDELYDRVAEHVVSQRRSGMNYPIYITDLDLSPALRDMEALNGIQTAQFLKYKEQIEKRLNTAISKL